MHDFFRFVASKHVDFIIRYPRLTPDSLKIPFSLQIDIFAAHNNRIGVNGASAGTRDILSSPPDKRQRFGAFTAPSFVNCMILHRFLLMSRGSLLYENHTERMTSHITGASWPRSMMSQGGVGRYQICDAQSAASVFEAADCGARVSVPVR